MKLVCLTGMGIGKLTYFILPKRREIVKKNLRIALGEEVDLCKIEKLAKQVFTRSGRNLIASLQTSLFSEKRLERHVHIEGAEHYLQAKKLDKGVICLLSHMGNWELLAQIHTLIPEFTSPATLYRPLDNPLIDDLIKRRRGRKGTKLFSRRDGFFKPITHVKNKGSLGVLADQNAGQRGLTIPFFGKNTSMTSLPALLHRRTGAPILPISVFSNSLTKWTIVISPPIDIPETKKSDALYITSECAKAYETLMRKNPTDVFWMHRYWKP